MVGAQAAPSVERWIAQRPTPAPFADLLATSARPADAAAVAAEAQSLYRELCVRLAGALRDSAELPAGLACRGRMRDVRRRYLESLSTLNKFSFEPCDEEGSSMSPGDVARLAQLVTDIARRHAKILAWTMEAVYELAEEMGSDFEEVQPEINEFLERFLLVHIGLRFRMKHFVEMHRSGGSRGALATDANCAQLARATAKDCRDICQRTIGAAPPIVVLEEGRSAHMHSPDVLRYVLNEVLKNACRATVERHGDGHRSPLVRCKLIHGQDGLRIRVSDEGSGIAPESLDKVFRFAYSTFGRTVQDGEAKRTTLAGFGVGLSMVRLYMRYFGGDVSISSELGRGTVVTLTLPHLSRHFEVVPGCTGPRPLVQDANRVAAAPSDAKVDVERSPGTSSRRTTSLGEEDGCPGPSAVAQLLRPWTRGELPAPFAHHLRLLHHLAGRLIA